MTGLLGTKVRCTWPILQMQLPCTRPRCCRRGMLLPNDNATGGSSPDDDKVTSDERRKYLHGMKGILPAYVACRHTVPIIGGLPIVNRCESALEDGLVLRCFLHYTMRHQDGRRLSGAAQEM